MALKLSHLATESACRLLPFAYTVAICYYYTEFAGGVVAGGMTGRALDLSLTGRGFKSCSGQSCVEPWASCSHLCASVTKQYNLVPAKGRWCCAAGKVTAGLAESNSSLLPCGLTACTLGSALDPTLGKEFGKPLPFYSVVSCYCHT